MKHIKKLFAACCSALICFQYTSLYTNVSALETSANNEYSTTVFDDDPGKFKYINSGRYLKRSTSTDNILEAETTDSALDNEQPVTEPIIEEEIIHKGDPGDYFIIDGIDVSKYQPVIDWEAVAADGIKFAIIRVGYRGYGTEGNLRVDDCFEMHINGALEAGIDVGVYFFTQAITEEEAVEEANFVLEQIEDYDLTMPVFFDIESIDYDTGRLDSAGLTIEQNTANCDVFCQTIEEAGYKAGIYANKYWLQEKLDTAYLESKYPIWLARYSNSSEYDGEYRIWQYTSKGTVDGINAMIDRNFLYIRKAGFEHDFLVIDEQGVTSPHVYGDGKITFRNSDPSIARIDKKGNITPLKNGITTITAVSDNGSEASMDVVVAAFTQVKLNYNELEFDEIGTQKKLAAKSGSALTWRTSDPTVVSVNKNGVVEAVGAGTAMIFATDSTGNIGLCSVTVNKEILIGDCNVDGEINALDAAILLSYAAAIGAGSSPEIDESLFKAYDVDCNQKIDALDAAKILTISAAAGVAK